MKQQAAQRRRAQEPGVPVTKFLRLIEYLDQMGLDGQAVAARTGIDIRQLRHAPAERTLPTLYYCLLYNDAVALLQTDDLALPWGAGIGGRAFRFMAMSMIHNRTLGEALEIATEFETLVSPRLKGDRMRLERSGEQARLLYQYRLLDRQQRFVPRGMQGTVWPLVVGRGAGLTVWHAFCGWLIGRTIELERVGLGGGVLPDNYRTKLERIFRCPVAAVEGDSCLVFDARYLDARLVQDADSLQDLFRTGPFQLMQMDNGVQSTSAAIRSLLGTRFVEGLPGFEEIAARLGMSASSLRRQLMRENTSYQKLKDECRRDAAIRLLQAEHSVADISERLGFSETSCFIRSFRTWTGTTPHRFREQLAEIRN